MAEQKSDLQVAVEALLDKEPRHTRFWKYYDGEQPLIYSSDKLREIFEKINARFAENWCAVVVDSVLDKLQLQFPSVKDNEQLSTMLQELWQNSGIWEEEENVHEDVTVTGEAFVIAWLDDETQEPQAFWQDSRQCYAHYSADNPRKMLFAAKWWKDDEDYIRLNLYYEDRIEYYRSSNAVQDVWDYLSWTSFDDLEETAENPYGRIPVFHFRSNKRRPKSQLKSVIEIQDAVNKLVADMMIAAEFGAFPQRYAITLADISDLKNSPNEIWQLPPAAPGDQPTSIGQLSSANLSVYLEAINKLTADIGIISRTPKHYFFAQGDPSGAALEIWEGPLNKKVGKMQTSMQDTWEHLAQFLLTLAGQNVDIVDVFVEYDPPQTEQPLMTIQVRKGNIETGIPRKIALQKEGWSEQEIADLEQAAMDEQVLQASFAQAQMAQAEQDFNRGQPT